MNRTWLALASAALVVLAPGCPSSTPAPGNDAARTDGGGAVDAASAADTGSDASPGSDAGIDCSTVGCGAPPLCSEGCTAPCGCCPCSDGSEMGTYVCTGGCWAPRGTGASGDPCSASTDCGSGLSCCYPCGTPGCSNQCTPTCTPGDPGCFDGCLALP